MNNGIFGEQISEVAKSEIGNKLSIPLLRKCLFESIIQFQYSYFCTLTCSFLGFLPCHKSSVGSKNENNIVLRKAKPSVNILNQLDVLEK